MQQLLLTVVMTVQTFLCITSDTHWRTNPVRLSIVGHSQVSFM